MATPRRQRDLEPGAPVFPEETAGGHDDLMVEFIRTLTYFYLKTDRRSRTIVAIMPGQIVKWPFNQAYPRAMEPLIKELERLTSEIPIDPPGAIIGNDVPQWRADRDAWRERLRGYRELQNKIMQPTVFRDAKPDGPPLEIPIQWDEASEQYLEEVALPLLLGWYPGADVQKPLDAVTPISLAYQAQILSESWRRNISKLGEDLKENLKTALAIGTGIAGVAVAALAVYGIVELVKLVKEFKAR